VTAAPPRRPTIAVVGTLTLDTTTYADGARSENLGGLVYTLSALAALFEGGARILPVANVGVDLFDRIFAALDLPGVDRGLLHPVPTPNNHVHLTYLDAERRDEVLRGLVPPVAPERLAAARDADWLLVNLTSGRDTLLPVLAAFRADFAGTIQLDLHSLTLALLPDGRRELRRPADWEAWAGCADYLQVNQTEAALLAGRDAPAEFARAALDLGPRGVVVTLAGEGAVGAWRDERGTRHAVRCPAPVRPEPPYPTGCGDVFGAGFAYARLRGAEFPAAVALATAVASTKACFEPQAEIRRLRTHAARYLDRWA
jgi:sugar/nucleoside kinase (ribokinase family)